MIYTLFVPLSKLLKFIKCAPYVPAMGSIKITLINNCLIKTLSSNDLTQNVD